MYLLYDIAANKMQLLCTADADTRLADFDAEARVYPTRKFLL
jgi:hypothetical protein